MMSENDPGAKPPGTGRRPPTIELTATEIPSEQKTQNTANASGPSPSPGEAEPPRDARPSDKPQAATSERSSRGVLGLLAAGGAGALLVVLLGGAVWVGMLLGTRSAIREQPVAAAAPTPDPALTSRIAGAEDTAKSAASEIAALRGRIDEIAAAARTAQSRAEAAASTADAAQKAPATVADAARTDIDALSSRVADVERAVTDLRNAIEKKNTQADDKASRLAIAAAAIQTRIESGGPFTSELAAAKALGADAKAVAALDPFAGNGVPTAAQLQRELRDLLPAMRKTIVSARAGNGILDKLQENAERLVRIRPVGEVAGDDPSAVLARVEAKQSDIEAVLGEMTKLPAATRAPAEAWIKTAQARQQALAAGVQMTREALAALGHPSP